MEDSSRNAAIKPDGKRKSNACPSYISTAVWDSRTHAVFVNLCIDEVRAGNRSTNYFTKKGWANVTRNFNVATGRIHDHLQLKNHLDAMKKEWELWEKLVGKEIGLGWDYGKQTVDAPDDWWEAKIKTHQDVAKFRERGLSPEQRKKYDELFGGAVAVGEYTQASSSDALPYCFARGTSSRRSCNVGDWSTTNDVDATNEDEHVEGETTPLDDFTPDAKTEPMLEHSNKKATASNGTTRGTGKRLKGAARFLDQVDRLVEAVERRSTTTSVIDRYRERTSIKAVMDALTNLSGVTIGDEIYMLGTRLFTKQDYREMFIALPNDEVKLLWLRFELKRESAVNPLAWMRGVPAPGPF